MADRHEHDLIERAQAGESYAFASLIEAHYPAIFRIAYKWCGNREDAEDIAQDVAIKLGRTVGTFKGNAAFSTWIYRITLNAVRDFQRKAGRRAQSLSAMAHEPRSQTAPDEALAQSELWRKVRTLAPKQRDAVLLVYAEGLNHAEAARAMNCAEKTVSWHIHQARKRLKRLLEE